MLETYWKSRLHAEPDRNGGRIGLKLNKEKKITFLISSHYLDELSKIATHFGFMNNGKILKEITKKELEENSKKRVQIQVSNINACVAYLEETKILYNIIKEEEKIEIYGNINISKLVLDLSNKNCIITDLHEKEASLESYYMNLIGGEEND